MEYDACWLEPGHILVCAEPHPRKGFVALWLLGLDIFARLSWPEGSRARGLLGLQGFQGFGAWRVSVLQWLWRCRAFGHDCTYRCFCKVGPVSD